MKSLSTIFRFQNMPSRTAEENPEKMMTEKNENKFYQIMVALNGKY